MYSLVIRIAIDLNKAVELINTMPMPRFINDIVEMVIADPDPNNFSMIIHNTFFLFELLYFFL